MQRLSVSLLCSLFCAFAAPFSALAQFGVFPDTIWTPAEYDKSQAVMVSWPYPPAADHPKAVLWSKVIDAVQNETRLLLRIGSKQDTTEIRAMLAANGVSLRPGRYKYIVRNFSNVAIRDFGPVFFYANSNDTLAMADLNYGSADPLVESFPKFLAQFEFGYPLYEDSIRMNGGHYMTDGWGKFITNDYLVQANANGFGAVHAEPWFADQTYDTLKKIFKYKEFTELQSLLCEGGTANLDQFVKFISPSQIVITQYPIDVVTPDNVAIENNASFLQPLKDIYNKPMNVITLPMPTSDDGTYKNTNCVGQFADYRSYTGGVFVNSSYLLPIFSDTVSGNRVQDEEVVNLFKSLLPNYTIIPIDARVLALEGKSLHSITLNVPAKNPFRFLHDPITGAQTFNTDPTKLTAKVSNYSGISTVICYFKVRVDTGQWRAITLVYDSAGSFAGQIPYLGFQKGDTIDYYLTAYANNGGSSNLPFGAPNQYYTYYYPAENGISDENPAEFAQLSNAYPNPANEQTTLSFTTSRPVSASLAIIDPLGRETLIVRQQNFGVGAHSFLYNTKNLPKGVYFYQLKINGAPFATKRLVVLE